MSASNWDEETIDRIYEASVLPELWPRLLDDLAAQTGHAGAFIVSTEPDSATYWTSGVFQEPVDILARTGLILNNVISQRCMAAQYAGFLADSEVIAESEMLCDPIVTEFGNAFDMRWGVGTIIHNPAGFTTVVRFNSRADSSPTSPEVARRLTHLRSHLARATTYATLEKRSKVAVTLQTLDAFALPAAAICGDGKVYGQNAKFERLAAQVRSLAFDRMQFTNANADRLFRSALAKICVEGHPGVRSFPIPAIGDKKALIAHMLPIRRCARDLFRSSLAVLVLTPLDKSGLPPLELLHGLFDLTPAEATLARALCEGVQIGAFAKSMGVKRDTIKKRLDAIFQKTGVRRQSDLVRLLLGLSPIGDDEPNED